MENFCSWHSSTRRNGKHKRSYREAGREEMCCWKTLATSLHFQFMETRERSRFAVLMMETCICLASSFGALDQTTALSRTFQSPPIVDKLAQSDHIRSESHFNPVLPSMIYCAWCLPGDPVSLHAGSNPLPCLPVPPPPNCTSPGLRINRIRTGCWRHCGLSLISSILSSSGQVPAPYHTPSTGTPQH